MDYPVTVTIDPPSGERNRLTTAFRIILAIPHLFLVGGLGVSLLSRNGLAFTGEGGVLGAVAGVLAIVSWFTIVLGGPHIAGIREFTRFFLRWRVRAIAYVMLLEDRYPPFGDGPYPTTLDVVDPALPRDRVSVGFRLLLGIPHFIVLFFIAVIWCFTSFVGWLSILVSGSYPKPLYDFSVGVLRWHIRVEAYMFLLVDAYPPFSFD
ncbi:MAG TPA: DUF4389 domain-containing protein [Vicinamibacterales bacterium]|nr:DUF4389 domain-containing protein [Vicinamibacterales bacterium]